MSRFGCILGAALTLVFATVASADQVGFVFDVTTHYQAGSFPGALTPFGDASPDTGFFIIMNNGTTTFTGNVGDIAVSTEPFDYSFTSPVTLAPGQSYIQAVNDESSNKGGYNGPFGSPQPGVALFITGTVTNGSGSEMVNLSVNDADIHSGSANTSPCDGILTDAFVLQGGAPTGCDNGDGFEEAQADGHFEFSQAAAVPEPGYIVLTGIALPAIFLFRRRRAAK